MNYRHAYHAGNFADVLKHVVLALCVEYLQRKDGPLCFIDAHAGAGLYDLGGEEAQKTAEWGSGVGRVWGREDAPAELGPYLGLIREEMEQGRYPGSPLMIARSLRPQDRLVASELHHETHEELQWLLRPYGGARTMAVDAYQCLRAHIPPRERRGLALIDPPFEQKDEFETLALQMEQWKKRWATGVYLLWHPIKAHQSVDALKNAARDLGLRRTWSVEALVAPRERWNAMNGCGVIVFNAPYSVPERVEALLPWLKEAMGLHDAATEWLTDNS